VDIELLAERYAARIGGELSGWDRVLVLATLPKICCAGAMSSYRYERKVRIFDHPNFAELFGGRLRENAERVAAARGEFNVSRVQNKILRRCLSGKTSAQVSRRLKRLHGPMRNVSRTYKYQVVANPIRQTGHPHRTQALRTGRHPATCLRSDRIISWFPASFAQIFKGWVLRKPCRWQHSAHNPIQLAHGSGHAVRG
jgi:hypothetical protein